MRGFRWLSARALPWERDLRRCAWRLRTGARIAADDAVLLAVETPLARFDPAWLTVSERRRLMVVGADDPARLADLFAWGCGDALASDVDIGELAVRAHQVYRLAQYLPRLLAYGRLTLDLMLRDAKAGGSRLGLHPREFALPWRLIEAEGSPLSAAELIAHVWQLTFRPETNSLAVHISRLRRKLAQAGLGAALETVPGGSYRLRPAPAFDWGKNALDADSGLREDAYLMTEANP